MSEYANCPYCGEQISAMAKSCPHCGSDELTGWSEKTYLDGIDYDYEDQYEEINAREFEKKSSFLSWQMITGAALLVVLVLMILISNL